MSKRVAADGGARGAKTRALRADAATVYYTGCRVNDVLRGCSRLEGLRILVTRCNVSPEGCRHKPAGDDELGEKLVSLVADHLVHRENVPRAEAVQIVRDGPCWWPEGTRGHTAIGADGSVEFVVIQPGPLTDYARESGRVDEFESRIARQFKFTSATLLELMGTHTLCLAVDCLVVEGRIDVVPRDSLPRGCVFGEGDTVTKIQLTLPPDAPPDAPAAVGVASGGLIRQICRSEPDEVHAEAAAALRDAGLDPDACLPAADSVVYGALHKQLLALAPGALKSLVQKCVRLAPVTTTVPVDADGRARERISTQALAAVATTMLYEHPGSLVPDLQIFVTGRASALKRLAVILYEDAYLPGAPINELLAAALLVMRNPMYVPPMRRRCAALAAQAVASNQVYDWRTEVRRPASIPYPAYAGSAEVSYLLLNTLRSFPGDLAMFRAVAGMIARGAAPLPSPRGTRPAERDISALVDQHGSERWVANVIGGELCSAPTAAKFAAIHRVSGTNWRAEPLPEPDCEIVRAQKRVYQVITTPVLRADITGRARTAEREHWTPAVSYGALGAGVGAIPTWRRGSRNKYYVIPGMHEGGRGAAEAVVLRDASARGPARDLLVTDAAERAQLLRAVSYRNVSLRSPLVPKLNTANMQEDSGRWRVRNSRDSSSQWTEWDDYYADARSGRGLRVGADLYDEPTESCFTREARIRVGVVRGAWAALDEAVAAAPHRAVSRLHALMCFDGSYQHVTFPLVSRDGKGAAGEFLRPLDCVDGPAHQLACEIARWVPGALSLARTGNFTIRNALLYQRVREAVARGLPTPRFECAGGVSGALGTDDGTPFRPAQERALAQIGETEAAQAGGKPGRHMLLMRVGTGKTLTALTWLRKHAAGGYAALWTVKQATVEAVATELRKRGASPFVVSRRSNAEAARLRAYLGALRPGSLAVVSEDVVRMVGSDLERVAHRLLVVFDEFDQSYGNTQRTAAAMKLAMECAGCVLMTGTMVRHCDNQGLTRWLALVCSHEYPVTAKNTMAVVAGRVVHESAPPPVETETHVVTVPATRSALEVSNDHALPWRTRALAVQAATLGSLVDTAARCVGEHGGAFVVAGSAIHAGEIVCALAGRAITAQFVSGNETPVGSPQVTVVTQDNSRGYNWAATQYCAMVTGVYGSNEATREQMVGRLVRPGQTRTVHVYRVVMADTITESQFAHHEHDAVVAALVNAAAGCAR